MKPTRRTRAALLGGMVADETGAPMLSVHSTKGTLRYRYYVSKDLHHKQANKGRRVPAKALDDLVIATVARLFSDPLEAAARLALLLPPSEIGFHIEACARVRAQLMAREHELVRAIVRKVSLLERSVVIELDPAAVARVLGHKAAECRAAGLTLTADATLNRSGRVLRLVDGRSTPVGASVDPSLVRLIAKAHRWWRVLKNAENSVTGIAAHEGVTKSYVTRVVRLAFLSPRITAAILEGRQSTSIGHRRLTSYGAIALDWSQQEATLLG